MTIEERRVGSVTVLRLRGRLVLDDGDAELRQAIDDLVGQGRVQIVADFTGVDYIDSAGVGVLIAKFLSTRRKGGDLKLLGLTPRPAHVLEISHLRTVFQIFELEDQAVLSFTK